jgi:aldehyde:ferredoxin oxidoreductase
VGRRTVTLERHFNNQRGFDRADDRGLPYDLPDFEQALDEYYDQRGWEDGVVPETALPEDVTASSGGQAAGD